MRSLGTIGQFARVAMWWLRKTPPATMYNAMPAISGCICHVYPSTLHWQMLPRAITFVLVVVSGFLHCAILFQKLDKASVLEAEAVVEQTERKAQQVSEKSKAPSMV